MMFLHYFFFLESGIPRITYECREGGGGGGGLSNPEQGVVVIMVVI